MGIKKKLGLGLASAALGLSLVGGGTYAFFSDTAEATSSFAAGKLSLTAQPTEVINIHNIKPGDSMTRTFNLVNDGTLDMSKVLLKSEFTVNDVKLNGRDNVENFAKHIKVQFLRNTDKLTDVIEEKSLYELTNGTDVVNGENDVLRFILGHEADGLKANSSDVLKVRFVFKESNLDQNDFQGDSIQLKWTFTGQQTAGKEL